MVRFTFIIALLLLNILHCSGQYYDIGQDRWSINWRQARTENFRVIFPDYYDKNAIQTAVMLEQWRIPASRSLRVIPPYTPVVLHTGNVYSNAFTIWAPRRLEFLTIPPQDIYGQSWLEQLVLHEYRHIAQISKVNQGFTKTLSYIFGQQAAPAIIGLFVPPWFMEGDAVAVETGLTHTGRGRVADFAMPLKAQLKEKGAYHYTKATLGSYKDFTPNHYILGYHIVATARSEYGIDIWNSALNRTGRKPYTLNPFSKGIKLIAGTNKKGLYNKSMMHLDSLWDEPQVIRNFNPLTITEQSVYTNYTHPFKFMGGIIALKQSLKDIHRFVFIDSIGNEELIYTPGFLFNDEVAFNGKWISWTERRPHVRWDLQAYSTLVLLDPASDEVIKIKTRSRLFAPTVSPDNSSIVTSEVTEAGTNYLTFLNLSGNITLQVPSINNMFISSPSWSPDNNEVVCILTGDNGKQLAIYSIADSTIKTITPVISDEIADPQHLGDRIIFNMDVEEKNEICSFIPGIKEIMVLTNSMFGTKHPYIGKSNGNILLLSYYTSDGYRIVEMQSAQQTQRSITWNNNNRWPLATALGIQENALAETTLPDESMTITDYSKTGNLFNFHSWAPVYVKVDDQEVSPGVSIMSQNLLSTLFLTAGYDYNLEEEAGKWRAELSWRGWFPEINTAFSYGGRSSSGILNDTVYNNEWNEASWDLSIGQWLSTYSGQYSYGAYFEVRHQLINRIRINTTHHAFGDGIIGAFDYRAYGYILSKQAYRDLAPPLGLTVNIHYKNSPYGDYQPGDLSSVQTRIYLPGLIKNHSFQLFAALQQLNPTEEGYRFSADIGLPAGYNQRIPNKMLRLRPSYSLPIAYPDFNVGTAFYLKRIRGTAFYDHAFDLNTNNKAWSSIGADLLADFHLLSLPAPLSAGFRSAYLTETGNMHFSLIFSFDLSEY